MGYRAERQAQIDQDIAQEQHDREITNRTRWYGAKDCCPSCGDVKDGMQDIDADYIIRVLKIRTEAALWDISETAARGTDARVALTSFTRAGSAGRKRRPQSTSR